MFFLFKINYFTIEEFQTQQEEEIEYSYESIEKEDIIIVNAEDRILALKRAKEFYNTSLNSISEPILFQNPSLKICNIEPLQVEIDNLTRLPNNENEENEE